MIEGYTTSSGIKMAMALYVAVMGFVFFMGFAFFMGPSESDNTTTQPAVVLSVNSENHFLSGKSYDVVVENSKTKVRSSFTSSDGVSASYNKGDKVSVEYLGDDALGFSDEKI